ncbi:transcriptional regulator, TetR family [Methylocella silvestris BL2]|uniref:Transcriptional regulator, TetR family n=2 Tax=Methylocella silvestris TaxID=199596 RepID=B8EQU1_METSB|nr:transcriptional regulator, TetR family [Methylocella silvestris BL2]
MTDQTKRPKLSRRRGMALEKALLQVAWEQLTEGGYSNFTMDAVADRSHTSRPVIYRRWSSRAELAIAAIGHHVAEHPVVAPDLGRLRDEMISVLQQSMERGALIAGIIARDMSDLYRETKATPSSLRQSILGAEGKLLEKIIERAVARGELSGQGLTPRLISLPADLLRHEAFMTLAPVPASTIAEIVDDIVLPLLRLHDLPKR